VAGSIALWLFLASSGLSFSSLAVGLLFARQQRTWWETAKEAYERAVRLRVSDSLSTAEKGEALAESVRQLYRRMGYDVPPHRRGRDRGIDVIVQRFGRYGIQCKNVQAPASIDAVYEAYAGSRYWGCCQRCAIAVSPAGFTDEATDFAARVGVHLIDDREFRRLMQRLCHLGVFRPRGVARVAQIVLLLAAIAIGGFGGALMPLPLVAMQPLDAAAYAAVLAAIGAIAGSTSRVQYRGPESAKERPTSAQPQPAGS
jgi:hypothetical protein